jgi:GT2 family glycosyltransferase
LQELGKNNKNVKNEMIAVLIPSYDRPEILRITLPRWLKARHVGKVLILAQASSEEILNEYEKILKHQIDYGKVTYKLVLGRLGSVKARNVLLDLVSTYNYKYVIMSDDDHFLLDENCLARITKLFELDSRIGVIGGKIITKRLGKDPDFFLNLPINIADLMSRLTGYVFLDIKHGPRYSEFLPPIFIMRKEVIDKGVRYDEILDSPTGFREESDLQLQIKNLSYKLLYDPGIYVIHLVNERGGNRPKMSMAKRIYWKSLTHTVFILKWNKSFLRKIWYMLVSILILSFYRTWYILWILKGVKDGIRRFSQSQYS